MRKFIPLGSDIDPITWKNHNYNVKGWTKTLSIDEAETILLIDTRQVYDKNDKKCILFLSEPSAIIPSVYELLHYKNFVDKFSIIGTCHKKFILHDNIIYINPTANCGVSPELNLNKQKLVSMIFSGKNFSQGHKLRHSVAKTFEADKFGEMFNNRIEDKKDGLRDYCFSYTIENCSEQGYYTEKINDCFLTGTIPIYWGDPDIGNVYNTDGIIFLDELDSTKITKKYYDTKIKAIEENYNIALKVIVENTIDNGIQKLFDCIT